jgi:hypothetical protein
LSLPLPCAVLRPGGLSRADEPTVYSRRIFRLPDSSGSEVGREGICTER